MFRGWITTSNGETTIAGHYENRDRAWSDQTSWDFDEFWRLQSPFLSISDILWDGYTECYWCSNGQVEYYLSDENLATDSFFQAPCIISENRVHMGTPKVDEAYRFPIHKVMVFWVFRGIPVSWTNMYDVMMSFASHCFAFPLKPWSSDKNDNLKILSYIAANQSSSLRVNDNLFDPDKYIQNIYI